MLKRFPNNWLMNAEHKGNILNKQDINYISQKIFSLTSEEGVDLYTSDLGIEKKEEDEYIHEEEIIFHSTKDKYYVD